MKTELVGERLSVWFEDELDPRWSEVWVTPNGGRLAYVGETIMSQHDRATGPRTDPPREAQ